MTIGAGAGAGVLLMMIGAGAGAGATTMLLLFARAEAATGTRRTSQLGGPLPFPGDAGGQVSRPILPSTPSQDFGRITPVTALNTSDSVDYDFHTIAPATEQPVS